MVWDGKKLGFFGVVFVEIDIGIYSCIIWIVNEFIVYYLYYVIFIIRCFYEGI